MCVLLLNIQSQIHFMFFVSLDRLIRNSNYLVKTLVSVCGASAILKV